MPEGGGQVQRCPQVAAADAAVDVVLVGTRQKQRRRLQIGPAQEKTVNPDTSLAVPRRRRARKTRGGGAIYCEPSVLYIASNL